MRKRGAVVATGVAAAVAVAVPAWAYFVLGSNATTATVAAAALGTPVTGTPAVTPLAVSFTVSPPASGLAPTGFRVDRTAPSEASGVCTLGASGGLCTDSSPVAGQTNAYAVYALRGPWSSITPATVTAAVPAGVQAYTVTPSTTTPVAGTPFTVTLTATLGGLTDTTYTGVKTVNWSGGQTIGSFAPAYPASVTFVNGVGSASVTLHKAGAQTLTVTDANTSGYTGSAGVTVSRANVQLTLACPSSAVRNTAVTVTLGRPAADAYGNAVTGTAVTATASATHAASASQSQSVTIASAATSQTFSVTLSNANNQTTVITTNAPAGYTAAASCSTLHT